MTLPGYRLNKCRINSILIFSVDSVSSISHDTALHVIITVPRYELIYLGVTRFKVLQ